MENASNDSTDALAGLAARVARLEEAIAAGGAPAGAPAASPARPRLPFDLGDDDADVVAYAGRASGRDGAPIEWQVRRSWDEVLASAGDGSAAALSALASGPRLRIVAELVAGPVATGDLAERLGHSSTGQLFHHLKELLAAGIVHQPQRGVYAIRTAHVVPVLAILCAATDLAPTLPQEAS